MSLATWSDSPAWQFTVLEGIPHSSIGFMKVYLLGSRMNSVKATNLGLYQKCRQEFSTSMQGTGNDSKNIDESSIFPFPDFVSFSK